MADALGVTSGSTKFAKKGRRAEKMVKEKDDPILNEFSLRKANDMKAVGMRVKFRTACRLEGELKKIHWMLSKLYERKVKSFFDFMMSVTWKYLPESDEELEIPIVPDLSSVEEQSVAFHCAVAPRYMNFLLISYIYNIYVIKY
ncbi:unnamed protein product [Schistosoma rodhaini]|uniref:Uncharacterized protein n=1 Tax=Schistosoma rodhaini TaxID=6188 RepID=A0AA85F5I6_9TREM|nr:unnamed protein product [Schistosoma rodhaini]